MRTVTTRPGLRAGVVRTLSVAAGMLLASQGVIASSHREAPFITSRPNARVFLGTPFLRRMFIPSTLSSFARRKIGFATSYSRELMFKTRIVELSCRST